MEKGAASEDEYIGTAFCTGFVETIINIAKEGEYNIISKYFRNETREYAAALSDEFVLFAQNLL